MAIPSVSVIQASPCCSVELLATGGFAADPWERFFQVVQGLRLSKTAQSCLASGLSAARCFGVVFGSASQRILGQSQELNLGSSPLVALEAVPYGEVSYRR